MKNLINTTETYRIDSINGVERLQEELNNDNRFTLTSFNYKFKQIKAKGEIIDEYYIVTAKKVFNDEKEPSTEVEVIYEIGE